MEQKKNKKRQHKVILFPGMVERLFEEAKNLAENERYTEANELFEQALLLDEGDEVSLSVFAYSLYEVKSFERAKEICEQLLSIGPNMYFEVMELYLTICMQMRQFKQVEKVIQSLMDEEEIPPDKMEKFERIKNLNAQIAEKQEIPLQDTSIIKESTYFDFVANEFLSLPVQQQMMKIQELSDINLRPYQEELKTVIETTTIHPFIQSLLLILLVEQEINIELKVTKFEEEQQFNPARSPLPTELPKFQEMSKLITEQLAQEPSKLEIVTQLMTKHAIVLYPFEWGQFSNEQLAKGYISFIKLMFGETLEIDGDVVEFLQNIEKKADLQQS